MQEINKEDFDSIVLKSDIPVLVDFFADWCMPCKMLTPILEKLSLEYEGKIKFVKINADGNDLCLKYKVNSIPDIIIFKDGEIFQRRTGLVSIGILKEALEDVTF